jgi:putative ABC transport system permease protein
MTGSSTETESGRGIVLMPERHSFGFDHFVPEIISVKVSNREFGKVMEDVHQAFDATFPGAIFQWAFLDEKVSEIYRHEEIARNQISTFTFLAILIAGLGLFGMISNRVVEKTKEIGVRKVMGARLHHIAGILVNTSARQLAVAAILGVPIAYYFTRQYLNKYSEQVPLTVWSYLFPISILVLILAGTVTVVVIRAAKNNPVEALKYE